MQHSNVIEYGDNWVRFRGEPDTLDEILPDMSIDRLTNEGGRIWYCEFSSREEGTP